MSEEKVEIDGDYYYYREKFQIGTAIVCAPTGIICTVQAGGAVCNQPAAEGYIIPLHTDNKDMCSKVESEFDDCAWGCHSSLRGIEELQFEKTEFPDDYNYERRKEYGDAINNFLNENINDKILERVNFSFDYDRLTEVMEGWWPVLIKYKPYCGDKLYNTEFKGYLYFGNCD